MWIDYAQYIEYNNVSSKNYGIICRDLLLTVKIASDRKDFLQMKARESNYEI